MGAYALNSEAVFFVLQPKVDALMDAQHPHQSGASESVRITRDRVRVSNPEAAAGADQQARRKLAGRGNLPQRRRGFVGDQTTDQLADGSHAGFGQILGDTCIDLLADMRIVEQRGTDTHGARTRAAQSQPARTGAAAL